MQVPFTVTSFYRFFPIEEQNLDAVRLLLERQAADFGLLGLIILAPEGLNGTVAGSEEGIGQFKAALEQNFESAEWNFKDSSCEFPPFRRFRVKIREEIVSSGRDDLEVQPGKTRYLTAEEWHRELGDSAAPPTVIDVRNSYETKLGKFVGAIDPETRNFQEFSDFVRESGIPKDQKVLMYCTGGIRCEKAALEMQRQGYQEVYQLQGGILKYLEQFPAGHFEGECFVFDHRVALDSELKPSAVYRLCPHCGDPGSLPQKCANCGKDCVLCEGCTSDEKTPKRTCSKDCEYQLQRKQRAAAKVMEKA